LINFANQILIPIVFNKKTMLCKKILLVLLFLTTKNIFGQTIFFQDTWQGGITGAGANVGSGTVEATYQFDIFIEPNSTIKKAFLISGTYSSIGEITVQLNSISVSFNQNTVVTTGFMGYETMNGFSQVHCADVTQLISESTVNYNLHVPAQNVEIGQRFRSFYLVVMYENPNLSTINTCVILNSSDVSPSTIYNIGSLNPIDTNNQVGFAFFGHAFCNTNFDGSYVIIENTNIGLVGGNDFNAQFFCSGTQGHFYYHNNLFSGLGDDIPNETMSGSDAIANIQNYIFQNTTSLNVGFVHQSSIIAYSYSNPITAVFLAHTSPCKSFETALMTSDTIACINLPVQLGVTVPDSINATYEWLPQTKLSCYDCPNPIFTGDSTINYTVRIWSTDSCSVVMPVRVRVVPQPNLESINLTENICGFESGSVAGTSTGLSLPHTYQLNDGVPQNNFSFSNLSAGQYTLTVTDANGCSQDSTVQIIEINNVQAAFSVNPSTGDAPLQVQTQNNSQNATQYEWFWEDQSSTLTNPSITLDTAGVYTLTLVAGNGATHCNDTASVMILVREPFEVFAYTFVTNEVNVYQIYLSGVSEYKYYLYTLDGKLVYQKSAAVENAGFVDLWEIGGVASGMYLFRIWVKSGSGVGEEIEGKLVVVR
jgi:hypothetical protein